MYSKNWKPVPYRTGELKAGEYAPGEREAMEQEAMEQGAHQVANTLSWTLSNGQEVHIRPIYDDNFECMMYEVKIGNQEWKRAELEPVRGVSGVVAKVGQIGLTAERKAALEAMEA